jgi:competence protein ComFC
MGSAVGALGEAIFPGRCLLCGGWLLLASDHSIPICHACRGTVPMLGGPRCTKCGLELISERGTCLRCRNADYMFDSNLSVFAYTGNAKRLLVGLKFEGRRRLAPFFAAHVAALLNAAGWRGEVVPVPPRPGRQEPDAAELVSRSLEKLHGVRVLRALLRTASVQQKTLDYRQRRENLKGQVRVRAAVPPKAILLDDVFTTGATLDACARALRNAGCTEVNSVTLVMEE